MATMCPANLPGTISLPDGVPDWIQRQIAALRPEVLDVLRAIFTAEVDSKRSEANR